MSIQRYINFENINTNIENEGKRIQEKDLFVISKNQKEEVDFGSCKQDVLEVSVYDVNNNLLPQKDGKNVAYIKMPDIKNYVYNSFNENAKKELAIDIERLLNDIGFFNGIYKVNLNFVKNKIGSDNDMTRVWIQEISPSREEIRILPLDSNDQKINQQTNYEFNNILDLSKNFIYYKNAILNFFSSTESDFLLNVSTFIESLYGKEYFSILEKDFGVTKFDELKTRIYNDFKTSVEYYLTNRYYNIGESNYGKQSNIRFESCENYDFNLILEESKSILFDCIIYNTTFLKKRNITIKKIPKEFAITPLRKDIKDNLDSFEVDKHKKRHVYDPEKVDIKFNDSTRKIEYEYDSRNEDSIRDENVEVRDENHESPKYRDGDKNYEYGTSDGESFKDGKPLNRIKENDFIKRDRKKKRSRKKPVEPQSLVEGEPYRRIGDDKQPNEYEVDESVTKSELSDTIQKLSAIQNQNPDRNIIQ